MLSKASNVMGLLAIAMAPLFTLILPDSITDALVATRVELKDAVLLGSVAALGFLIYSTQLIRFLARWISRRPFYSRINFNYIYLPDGTVIIRNGFDYVNGWSKSAELPREDLIWHMKITKNDLLYRFYERGKLRDRSMTSDEPTIISAVPIETGQSNENYRYSWVPIVSPPLRRKERISFVVEIMSPHTEGAAFQKGTKMGFGVNIATRNASLRAHAPFGYRFVLIDPGFTIRDSATLEEVSVPDRERPKPRISADGSALSVDVHRPRLNRRYWIHYRFEALDR